MKQILKFLGGSHSYSLNGPTSDKDVRGIFIHTEPKYILGLNRWDHQGKSPENGGLDEMFFELRNFCSLLKKGNTQCYEILFLEPEQIDVKTPEFDLISQNREIFLDSDKLYRCLKGYIQSERNLAVGLRTGKLGGKRYEQVLKLGFSPKNFVNAFRLMTCGIEFFESGIFPVNIRKFNHIYADFLMDIKNSPENYNKKDLYHHTVVLEEQLNKAFEEKNKTYNFNEDRVNHLIYTLYKPFL